MDPQAIADAAGLHDEAMQLAEQAALARLKGDTGGASSLLRRALDKERRAASLVASDLSLEPTRSVLHRSAASLAHQCGELREAEKLAAVALAGDPPDDIADELRDLLRELLAQTRRPA